jgi:hypothetical protein
MKRFLIGLLFATTTIQPAYSAGTQGSTLSDRLAAPTHKAQSCTERVGPFATQQRAWNVWRQAQTQGYSVSNGVFICYAPSRAYCFNVFYSC